MKPRDWRALSAEAIEDQLAGLRSDYTRLRAAVRRGQEKNNSRLPVLRADIARGLTILRAARRDARHQSGI